MNPSVTKPSLLKISAVFTVCVLIVDLVIDLLATHFKTSLLLRMLSWEYVAYDIIPELLITFLCAIGTIRITSKLNDFSWRAVILRILAFATLYAALCLLLSFTIFMAVNGTNFKLFNPLDYIFFITGIRVSFILLVVWMVLKYQEKTAVND